MTAPCLPRMGVALRHQRLAGLTEGFVQALGLFLVPGVGAQGGSLEEVCKYGMTEDCGLIVNSSRGIIYTSQDTDFARVAAHKAQELQQQMAKLLPAGLKK